MFLFGLSPVLAAVAIVPAIILLVYIYKLDRLEKEPRKLLFSLFILGALSTLPASLIETIGDLIMENSFIYGENAYNAVYYFIVVALTEELMKFLVLYFRTVKDPAFNCRFDGVVYGVFVSLGFAAAENIMYVAEYGLATGLLRAVTAIPGHACDGVFMGMWYGMSKFHMRRGNSERALYCSVMTIAVPFLIHGAYDYIATGSTMRGALLFIAYIAVLFIVSWRTVKRSAANDMYIGEDVRFAGYGGSDSGFDNRV